MSQCGASIRESVCENGRSIACRREESDLEALGYESLRSSIPQDRSERSMRHSRQHSDRPIVHDPQRCEVIAR